MNATLSPTEAQLAAYYQRGMVAEAHEVQLARRDMANAAHFEAWVEGRAAPDLVRLAEYVVTPDARLTPGEIERQLTRELERALSKREGGAGLPPEVRALHGLPDPEPIPAYLEGLGQEDLQRRLDRLLEQWSDAIATADYRADVRETLSSIEPNAPVAVIRPDLHPAVAIGLGIGPTRRLSDQEIDALLAGRRADGEKIAGKHYAKERRLPVDPRTGEQRLSSPIGSYDFCPTPDKSVSVAWAFAGPTEQAAIYDAHIQAAREAVAYIATRVGQVRLGNGGADGSEPGHVGWLEFTHHTSRRTQISIENGEIKIAEKGEGVPGDPDLHTHFLIPNAVFAESGKVGSLDSAAIPGFIFEADAYYHMRLTQHLSDAGFATELDQETGAARLPAIPDDVRTLFSKRTNVGELLARKMTADRGEEWDSLSKEQREMRVKNATQDRDQKIKGDKDDIANFDDWRRQAHEVCGWEAPASFRSRVYSVALPLELKRHLAYEVSLPILDERFQHRAVLQHFEPRIAAARGMIAMGGGDLDDVDAITATMREYGVQQYGESTPLIWGIEEGKRYTSVTTGLHEADEKEFVSLARQAAADRSGCNSDGTAD